MHELSIALSVIEQVEEEARKQGGGAVEVVYLRVGVLSGVDTEALRFSYEVACEGSSLAGSRLEIERVPLLASCPQCGSVHRPEVQRIVCPRCLTPEQKILEGRELELKAMELAA